MRSTSTNLVSHPQATVKHRAQEALTSSSALKRSQQTMTSKSCRDVDDPTSCRCGCWLRSRGQATCRVRRRRRGHLSYVAQRSCGGSDADDDVRDDCDDDMRAARARRRSAGASIQSAQRGVAAGPLHPVAVAVVVAS